MMLILMLSILFGEVLVDISCFECLVFDTKHGHKSNESFQAVGAVSLVDCASQCSRDQKCKIASFNEDDGICELSELSFDNADVTSQHGWSIVGKYGKTNELRHEKTCL